MGLGSLRRHDIQLTCRIRGETNHSSSYKQISPNHCASIEPKPHSLAYTENTEVRIMLFY